MQDTILIVDDKKVNRIILERHLQRAGYENIFHASDGQEALDKINEIMPDLILLDIVMPKINGLQVCRTVKQNEATRMLPIVMVTALDDQDSKLKCIEFGADDILNKPVDPAELTARVRSLINVKRYYEQIKHLNNQLMNSIKKAQKIQQALLPNKFPEHHGLFFDSYYKPADYVGGDTYNVFAVNSRQICIYVADVTGHQFDAALLTVFLKEVISSYSRQVNTMSSNQAAFRPAECLTILDHAFKKEDFPIEIFITIYMAIYDTHDKTLTYSSAGFAQAPIIYGGQNIRELYCPGKMIMGLDVEGEFNEYTTILNDGEGILFYTDGLIEQMDHTNSEQFGIERVGTTLKELPPESKIDAIPKVLEELKAFAKSDKLQDDIAIINMYLE